MVKAIIVDIKIVAAVSEKYDGPPYLLELITTSGKIVLEYPYKEERDNDAQELRKVRDEKQANK